MSRYFDNTVDLYQKHCLQGRGKGSNDSYRPWFTTSEIPSHSRSFRCYWLRKNRQCSFLSFGELAAFYICEWEDSVLDIREQYPLEPAVTQAIAEKLSIKHPSVRGKPVVMTTDLLLTVKEEKSHYKAIQIKRSEEDLQNARTAEKIKIEEAYWASRGVPFEVWLSKELNPVLRANLTELAPYRNSLSCFKRSRADFMEAKSLFSKHPKSCTLGEVWQMHRNPGEAAEKIRNALAHKLLTASLEKKPINEITLGEVGYAND